MRATIKKSLIVILSLLFAVCMLTIGAFTVNADSAVEVTTFKLHQKAMARTDFDGNGTGIRFWGEISASEYGALKNADTDGKLEFGIILTTQDFVDAANAKVDSETSEPAPEVFEIGSGAWKEYVNGAENNPTEQYYLRGRINPLADANDLDGDGDKDEMIFIFALTEIKEYNFSRTFVAKAYYTTDGTNYEYASEIAERSIFTVASGAVADDQWVEDNPDDVGYFEGVVDTVTAIYSKLNLNVIGATGENGEAKVGDKLTFQTTISKPDDSKALDVTANVSCDNSKLLTANSDGSYTVNRIGDIDLDIIVGNNISENLVIENQETYTIDMATEVGVAADAGATYTLATSTINGRNGVYKYAIPTSLGSANADSPKYQAAKLAVKEEVSNIAGIGDYILFDFNTNTAACRLMLGEYDGLGAINLYSYPNNNFSSSTGKVRIYKSNEEGVVSDAATTWKAAASTTQWFTIAVKMEKEGSDFNIRFNPYGGAQNCYVDNFRIAKEIPVSDSATYLDISDFAFDGDTDGDSTMQTATIGERSGAYSVNLTDTADRLYVSNKNKIDLMTTSKAFSFDLYVPENSTCDLTFGAKGYDINQTAISDVMSVKLGVVTDDSTNLAENELYKYEIL